MTSASRHHHLVRELDVATGQVYGSIHRRHRAVEFKKFLTKLDTQIPAELDVHLICDNYTTHKTPTVAKWLDVHPRFHMHHTPTYSSWLNQVERWFALLTDKKLRRGAHRSIQALEKDIRDWIAHGTKTPSPSPGPRPPTKSSKDSTHIFNEFLAQDTRSGRRFEPQNLAVPVRANGIGGHPASHRDRMASPCGRRRHRPGNQEAVAAMRSTQFLAGSGRSVVEPVRRVSGHFTAI